MTFVARISLPNVMPPTRGYVHECGYDIFGRSVEEARNYLLSVLNNNSKILKPAEFVIAALYGCERHNKKIAELFGYGDINEWQGNPEVYSWTFENGVYLPEKRNIACGETIRVLGAEESYRIDTKSLEEYMSKPRHLGDLEPHIDV